MSLTLGFLTYGTTHAPSRFTRRVESLRRLSMARSRPPFALINLASAFLAGPWTLRGLVKRGKQAFFDGVSRTIRRIARNVIRVFPDHSPPTWDVLVGHLENLHAEDVSWDDFQVRCHFWAPQKMVPQTLPATSWAVPSLTTSQQVADWLDVSAGQLDWLADLRGWTTDAKSLKLGHYVRHWLPRRGGRFRLVESPKRMLKTIQRRILHDLLDRIPPHAAAHGFRRGCSILTYASPHADQQIVLRFDLRDFFPAIRSSAVHALFRTAGYPHEVACLLTGLCTTRVPGDIWENRPEPREGDARLGVYLRGRHLPQGAPTSPALANLCARRLDVRLHGLAQSAHAVYTRYADDLAFSGGKELDRSARRFQIAVAVIAAEEGFDLHFQKSRFMRRAVCQQLAGLVVNARPNVRRAVYDELKAILTNCIRHGPQTQNRARVTDFRRHLLGRIAHVTMLHPRRGASLRALFERISW